MSQSGLTINTQPIKLQRICVPTMPSTPRLQVAAVTCGGATLTYQWQRNRPVSIGGTGTWEDIGPAWPGYTGANTPTLDITVADSISGIRVEYLYRCYIVSSFPCYGTATTNVSQIIGVRKPVVKYLTPVDTSVCESYPGSDSKYPLRARIIGLSKKDSLYFTWRTVDMPGYVDNAISAHPNYAGWISTWNQSPDSLTLIKYLTLNQANSTTILLSWDQSKYYLQLNSPACGISDSTVVPKRQLTVHNVPNLSVTTPTINICQDNTFTMSYTVSNSQHDGAPVRLPLNTNWSIASITGDAALAALFTTTTGTGNGPVSIVVPPGHGLSVGTHTITLNTIVNTTDGSICGRILTSQDITVNVYPKPVVEFIVPIGFIVLDTSICQGTSGIIKFKVSNAMYNGNPVAWTVTVTDPSGLLAPATLSGTGNQVVTNTIPTTLAVGTHTVTITGITTSGTPSGPCTGIVNPIADEVEVVVLPMPTATLNTTVTENLCLGSTTTFTITISNTGGFSWLLYYTDATGSTLPGSPIFGTGDQTIGPFTTSGALTQGSYDVTLTSITLISSVTCTNTLTGQKKTVRIYDIPTITVGTPYGTACEGAATPTYSFTTAGAVFNPGATNLAWTLAVTGTFRGPTDSVAVASTALTSVFPVTGSGNGTFTFTPPTNLAPGRYILNITNISLTNSPSCNTSYIPPARQIILDVYPKPTAAIFGTSMTGNICEGDIVTYSIGITNAFYGPTGAGDLGWSMAYSNSLGGTIPLSPIVGSGNTVLGSYTTSSALLTGIYSLDLGSALTNTTHGCTRVITADTNNNTKLLRRVYPKPNANLSTSSINICEGTATSFNVTITNAQRYGSSASADSMQWTLATSGTFQAAPAGSASISTMSGIVFPTSGKGNKIVSVTFPNTMAAGRYTFYLANPTLASSPSCVGTIGPNSSIVINVYPKPTLVITPAVDSTCQGVSKPYTVTIGNAYYEPSASAVSWTSTYTSTVGAGTPPSLANGVGIAYNGTGNFTQTYNTAAINLPGTYSFMINNLSNSTHSCSYTTSDTFKLIVKQRPRLVILSSPSEVCFNTGALITYKVDSVAAGQAWSFTYTASPTSPSGPVTINGVGPVASATFTTNPFTPAGTGTITFNPISLTAGGGCAASSAVSTINIYIAGKPDVTSCVISGPSTICGNAASGTSTVNFDVTVSNMIVGPSTKTWTLYYHIIGTQDTSAVAGSQIFYQGNLTASGTGNGTFTFTTPHQTYNGTTADAGVMDVRTIVIDSIGFTNPTIYCKNYAVTDNGTTFNVNPRPRMTFTPANDVHVCVTSPVVLNFTVYGLAAGQAGTLNWTGVNPNSSVQTVALSGPSPYTGTITTAATVTPGYSIQTVTQITNTTTGCAAILDPLPKDTTIVDPPSQTGWLTPSYTVCEGNNSGTLSLTGTIVGTVTKWQYSENDGFAWLDFANTATSYSFTNATLTRRWRVIVKNLTCPADTSNEQIVFVHPQPKVQITTYTSGLCVGDSIRFTLSITGVPSNHTWKLGITKAGFSSGNGTATLTGMGSGNFSYALGGMTASSLVGTIQLNTITNDTTTCNKNYTSSSGHLMTVVVGSNSVAGGISLVTPFTGALDQTVCKGSNIKLKYVGSGAIMTWFSSNPTSGAFPTGWDSLTTNSNTFNFGTIDSTTHFRVRVKFGSCPAVVNAANQTLFVRKLATATISGSDTICENNTHTFNVSINGEPGTTVTLGWLEGSTGKTGSFSLGANPPSTTSPSTITTSTLTTTTSVILQSAQYTTTPTCPQNLYTNAIATATVNPQPKVTLNSVVTPVCQGGTSTINYTVSAVAATTTWTLTYKVGSSVYTQNGTGPGTYNITTPALSTPGSVVVEFVSIATTNLKTNCTSGTLSGVTLTITVDATTVPGTVASDVTICKGGSATVTVSGHNGTVTKWNTSTTGAGGTYSSVTSSATSYTINNIITNSWVTATSKNGVCPEATTTTPVAITVRELPTASISGSATVCSGSTATLSIVVSNTYSNPWEITYLEGVTTKTTTGTGDGTFSITTSALTSNTDVTLQSIKMTNTPSASNPVCGPTTLSSTITVNVNPNPNATLNSVGTPVCQGSTSTFSFTVTGVATGVAWSINYDVGTATGLTTIGNGSGTFTVTTPTLSTAGGIAVILNSISTTSLSPNCTTTLGVSKTITVDATTVAGLVNGGATKCKGSNSGTLTYSGGNGAVVRWEYSINGGATWSQIGSTTSTYSYSNLTATTRYRVVVKNGSCLEAISADTVVTIREYPTATISGSNTVCQGTSATLSIVVSNTYSNPWTITYLEGVTTKTTTGTGDGTFTITTSTLNGVTDVTLQSIALQNSSTTHNPACGPTTLSSTATINVNAMPNATLNSVVSPICQGSTSSFTFTVSNLNTSTDWTLSYKEAGISKTTSGTGPGTYTVATSTLSTPGANVIEFVSIATTNLSPNCTKGLSQSLTITVDATSLAATVSSNQTVCKGSNSGTITATLANGSVVRWEYSTDAGATWTTISNTTTSITFSNITTTTRYRVWTKNGACSEIVSSNYVIITVNELPTVSISIASGNNPICQYTKGTYRLTVANTYGNPWSVKLIEGALSKTVAGT
ncbi:MAG: hypothetical protein HUU47_02105, partial [Bacteroidetes bacterium]|nr:hypothetical protein [Bacteroidota bacterium]